MSHESGRTVHLGFLSLLLLAAGACAPGTHEPAGPASSVEASKIIDLAAFPLVEGASEPNQRNLAGLSYSAPGKVKDVFASQRKQLLNRKWQELPGGYQSDEVGSGAFRRDGYTLSLTVMPGAMAGQ